MQELLLEWVIPIGAVILTVFGAFLAYKVINFFERKFNIDIASADEQRFTGLVEKGIAWAERWAMEKAKAGTKPASAEKEDTAMSFILEAAKKMGLKERAPAFIKSYIKALLHMTDKSVGDFHGDNLNPSD